ncbi:MAG: filamentous hemagglutinin N-terminal domain-containing protein, partial [Alphaproteobacteria bacterium]|nr:filamentous hemagglutinin N-terminal domain-containing protein [Alphaproteobacteria bacterium]
MTTKNRGFVRSAAGFLTAVLFACPALAATTLPVTTVTNTNPGTTNIATKGTVTSTTSGTTMDFNQSSTKAVIDAKSFNVGDHSGASETVNFNNNSPATTMYTLVNIHDANPTKVYGTINDAHGVLYLVNTNGINFKDGSHVNVAGLIATTSRINADDFYNNDKPVFSSSGSADGLIVNDGTITVNTDYDTNMKGHGLVALVAPRVVNNGVINANYNRVHLASGDSFGIDLMGDGLINLAASDSMNEQLVKVGEQGKIYADGGEIRMTAATASNVVDSLINVKGLVQANSIDNQGGKIVLTSSVVGTSTDYTNKQGIYVAQSGQIVADGGSIEITANGVNNVPTGLVNVDGRVQADTVGTNTGSIALASNQQVGIGDGVAGGSDGLYARGEGTENGGS